MTSSHHYAVIMAGGGGTRLWPLSRKEKPKQLLPFLGDATLFQSTVMRLDGFIPPQRILVVTIAQQADEMRKQAPQIPAENYLIEPQPKGTAAVVGLAASVLQKRDAESLMAVLPADHFIHNVDLFHYLLRTAFDVAADGSLVTLGITPNSPSTAYGYIQQSARLDGEYKYPVYTVKRFVEKPDAATAQGFLQSGDYSWNSGIFVWRADSILSEIGTHMPQLAEELRAIGAALGSRDESTVLRDHWALLRSETIDYGIMERAAHVAVLPAGGLGWSDVGMWSSLFEVLTPDADGNIVVHDAPHLAHDTHNTLIYGSASERLIVTIGVDGLVIVDTGDVLLVCRADQAQQVRAVVEKLRSLRQDKYL